MRGAHGTGHAACKSSLRQIRPEGDRAIRYACRDAATRLRLHLVWRCAAASRLVTCSQSPQLGCPLRDHFLPSSRERFHAAAQLAPASKRRTWAPCARLRLRPPRRARTVCRTLDGSEHVRVPAPIANHSAAGVRPREAQSVRLLASRWRAVTMARPSCCAQGKAGGPAGKRPLAQPCPQG